MNLYNLKIFADTARLSSMTKAAQINHLSRPAVTQAIKKLEIELGVELLVHQRRMVQLTAAGRLLLKKSEDLLSEAEKIALLLKQHEGPMIRDFNIGSSRTLSTFHLPMILDHLRDIYPHINIKVHMANSAALIQKLASREIDLAFMIGDEALEGSKHTVVGRGHYVLVKPNSNKHKEFAYAITEKRPETERLRIIFERQEGKSLPVFAEIHSWDAIWQAVNEGICGGLIPDFLLKSKPGRKESHTVVIPKVSPYEVKVIHLASKSNDILVKAFIEEVKKVKF